MQNDLTQGSISKTVIKFSIPYLIASFLQAFYGLTDLFVTGQFNRAPIISAVSIGSQVTHMLTVVIVGLAMGSTVLISSAVGAKDKKKTERGIGNTISLFLLFSLALTVILLLSVNLILNVISTPQQSFVQARYYLMICFIGVPFITAYNVISSIFRGMGDSKSPMCFVAVAGVINIFLDFLFIGPLHMQAAGAALATVLSQIMSVIFALVTLKRRNVGVRITRKNFLFQRNTIISILKVGVPVAIQDGLIQVAFLVITAIANSRGELVSAAVGIVEKMISFLFLVPSAMLSTVSVIAAQNAGTGLHERGRRVLYYGIGICLAFGTLATVICQFAAEPLLRIFTRETEVMMLGSQYLRAYVFDCIFAGIHFCFSGYFCAYGKSVYSFLHNVVSILLIRIPGAYLASRLFPDTLFPMGMAAPAGSFVSSLICIAIFAAVWLRGDRATQEIGGDRRG